MWDISATVRFCVDNIEDAYRYETKLNRMAAKFDPVRGRLWSSKQTKLHPRAEESYRKAAAEREEKEADKMKTEEAQAVIGLFGDHTVFYTKNGKCFHVPNCPSVSKSSGNVTQMKRALEWDLTPCLICQPEEHFLYKEKYMSLR